MSKMKLVPAEATARMRAVPDHPLLPGDWRTIVADSPNGGKVSREKVEAAAKAAHDAEEAQNPAPEGYYPKYYGKDWLAIPWEIRREDYREMKRATIRAAFRALGLEVEE